MTTTLETLDVRFRADLGELRAGAAEAEAERLLAATAVRAEAALARTDAALAGRPATHGGFAAVAAEAEAAAEDVGQAFDRSLGRVERAIAGAAVRGTSALDALRRAASGVLGDLAGATLGLVTQPLLGELGDVLAGLLPGFAEGGPVAAGKPIVVGERGPEVFVPRAAGTVLPHGAGGGAGGGGSPSVVVNQTIHVTAGVAPTVRAEMVRLMPAIRRETLAAVVDAQRRSGGVLL